MERPPREYRKYELLWQIADRFFDDDVEDAKRLARAVGSIDAALARRAKVDAAVAFLEGQWQREAEARERRARHRGVAMQAFTVMGGFVGILVGLRALGQWWGFWP